MPDLIDILDALGHPHLLVLGDVMLDRYTWGDAARVSPEAPVLVLKADSDEVRPGGAASVAALLRGLDAEVTLCGVVGDDASGRTLRRVLADEGIEHAGLLTDADRPTTTKERFIGRAAARHPHQILRVDRERCHPIPAALERALLDQTVAQLDCHQALLISDYAKGVLTPSLLQNVIAAAREHGVPVIVDPALSADYDNYRGAHVLTPNRSEAGQATGLSMTSPDDALAAARMLCQRLDTDAVLVTLDSEGIALAGRDGAPAHFPTTPRAVYDITGAGDMVLAVVGLGQAAGLPLPETVRLANLAAGLEVERLGVAPVTRDELLAEFGARIRLTADPTGHAPSAPPPPPTPSPHRADPDRHSARRASRLTADPTGRAPSAPDHPPKLVTCDRLHDLVEQHRRAGRRVVFTNGCFDLLHVGHTTMLQQAAMLGDVLIVAVNSDQSVRRLKGPDRPVIGERDRAALLAALSCVDHVVIFEEDTPHELLHRLRPDVLVKGGTYNPDEVVGREVVEAYGGRVCVTGDVPDVSTTALLSTLDSQPSIHPKVPSCP